ncbi:MAG: ESX secretion-associated protein EspG [Labedaea sp.]
MVLPGPARLSVEALTWLLAGEGIGELHRVLAPAAVWQPADEVDAVRVAARAEITALGWFDRRQRLDVEVAASLAVLCRATTEFYGWINHDEATIGVLAGAIGGQALLAVRDTDRMWLKPTAWPRLAAALVGQTAEVPAGRGQPVTVTQAEILGAVRGQRLTEAAVQVTRASGAAQWVRRLVALPTTGSGELYAAVRDGMGRHRISAPIPYADTSEGRYVTVRTGAQVLVVPANRANLVARLTEAHRTLAR